MRPIGVVWVACLALSFGASGCAEDQGAKRVTTSENPERASSASDPNAVSPERQDAIERLFARKTPELQSCWSEEYEKTHDRGLQGDVTVQLDVSPSGQPSDVKVLKSTLNNPGIEGCVVKTVSGWSFPEGNATIPYTRTVHLGAQF